MRKGLIWKNTTGRRIRLGDGENPMTEEMNIPDSDIRIFHIQNGPAINWQEQFYGNNHLARNNNVVTIELNGGAIMEKTATLNLRVNPTLKQDAESVLERLGIPMSTAVDMFLKQIVLVGGIPFAVTLPNAPESIDATKMSEDQFHAKIQKGYESYKSGRTQNVTEAFSRFRENHS